LNFLFCPSIKYSVYWNRIFLPWNTTLVSRNRIFPEIWTRKISVSANRIFYQGQNRIFEEYKRNVRGWKRNHPS
jgi:hypothetical protein